jgi:hypothetical protein
MLTCTHAGQSKSRRTHHATLKRDDDESSHRHRRHRHRRHNPAAAPRALVSEPNPIRAAEFWSLPWPPRGLPTASPSCSHAPRSLAKPLPELQVVWTCGAWRASQRHKCHPSRLLPPSIPLLPDPAPAARCGYRFLGARVSTQPMHAPLEAMNGRARRPAAAAARGAAPRNEKVSKPCPCCRPALSRAPSPESLRLSLSWAPRR